MQGPSRELRRMQWIAIILVTAAIALNYMDRSTLAIGNLKIRQEFGLNATAIGGLGSVRGGSRLETQGPGAFAPGLTMFDRARRLPAAGDFEATLEAIAVGVPNRVA